jgi:hypothetical protein
MKRILAVLAAVAISMGVMSAPADAASGLKRHSASCKALGYKTKLAAFAIRKDGFGNKVGEIRMYGKSRSSNRLCTYTQRSAGVKASQFQAGVEVLVKSHGKYSYKTASSIRRTSNRSYSYTFKTLEGKKSVRSKTTMHLTGAILTNDDGLWWDTAYTRVG